MTQLQLVVNIDADDLDTAVDFYVRAFGLRPGRRLFAGSVAELLGATSVIHLLLRTAGSVAAPDTRAHREYKRHWTPVHLDFVVDDIASAVERASDAGATLEGDIETFEWGHLALMSDPFGHGLCVLQFAGNGYDAVADPD